MCKNFGLLAMLLFSSILFSQVENFTREWGTYLNGLRVEEIQKDDLGNLWIVSRTEVNEDFIIANYITPDAYQSTSGGMQDVVLTKFSPEGELLYGTFFGGEAMDWGYGLSIYGNFIIISGITNSYNQIATSDSFDEVKNSAYSTGYFAKFNLDGQLHWSTYFEGDRGTFVFDVALDNDENIIIASTTESSNLGTDNSFQPTIPPPYMFQDALRYPTYPLLSKFSGEGDLLWSTYYAYPEDSEDTQRSSILFFSCLAVDVTNSIYLTGMSNDTFGYYGTTNAHQEQNAGISDIFLSKFNANGIREWSTYFGGSENEITPKIEVLRSNSLYLSAQTSSENGISTSGTFLETIPYTNSSFLTEFNLLGNQLWGTYVGESTNSTLSLAKDVANNIFIQTALTDILLISNDDGFQNQYGGGQFDLGLIKLDSNGEEALWTSFYGGNAIDYTAFSNGIVMNNLLEFFISGMTESTNNISTINSFLSEYDPLNMGQSGFLAKFIPCPDPIVPAGEGVQLFTVGETVADLDITTQEWIGGEVYITWYSDAEGTQEIGTETLLQDGETYYVSQAIQGCPESELLAITATTQMSTAEIKNQNAFTISPNPATNQLQIHWKEKPQGEIHFEMYYANGQLVKKEKLVNDRINVSSLVAGTYLLKIITEKDTFTEKFIKE